MAKKYYKAKVGSLVTNGALKYRFAVPVAAFDEDDDLVAVLDKSLLATEIDKKEAKELSPDMFRNLKKEDKAADDTKTAQELRDEALALGVSEEDVKAAKKKDDLLALIEKAKKAGDEDEKEDE